MAGFNGTLSGSRNTLERVRPRLLVFLLFALSTFAFLISGGGPGALVDRLDRHTNTHVTITWQASGTQDETHEFSRVLSQALLDGQVYRLQSVDYSTRDSFVEWLVDRPSHCVPVSLPHGRLTGDSDGSLAVQICTLVESCFDGYIKIERPHNACAPSQSR
jgi:hypothetical protein